MTPLSFWLGGAVALALLALLDPPRVDTVSDLLFVLLVGVVLWPVSMVCMLIEAAIDRAHDR